MTHHPDLPLTKFRRVRRKRFNWDAVGAWSMGIVLSVVIFGFATYGFLHWWLHG